MGTEPPSIGIFDADRGVSSVLAEILSAEGYRPTPVSASSLPDPAAVAAMLSLLVDFPPDREGREEARHVINELRRRAAPERLPVIGLTADMQLMRRAGSRFEGVTDFAILGKPFGLNDLTDLLALMLARTGRAAPASLPSTGSTGLLFTDGAGRYTDANRAALAMLGYTLEELRRLRVSDVMDATERATTAEWARYRREGRWAGETVRLRRKDGGALVAQVHASVIRGDRALDALHVAWIRPRPSDDGDRPSRP